MRIGLLGRPPASETSAAPLDGHERDVVGTWVPAASLIYALAVTTYFVVRADGHWAEVDSGQQALAMRSVWESGTIMPETGLLYPSGYGYAAVSAALLNVTGISVGNLQQIIYPLISSLLVFPAWALYHELTGSRRVAAFATLLLFIQPELLFVVLRGSHERMIRTLMLIALWLLIRSFRFRDRPGHFVAHVILFYLASFGIIAVNALFGISFITAIATAMALAWALGRWRRGLVTLGSRVAGRLTLVAFALAALGFFFIAEIYPPAGHSLRELNGLADKVGSLVLTTQAGSSPYTQVIGGWTSVTAYFLLSIQDYLLMGTSALIWLWQGLRWIRGSDQPPSLAAWLLWLLYAAFAFQGALAIVGDRTGVMGSNLQHRSFPSFAMVATPLVAAAICRWSPSWWARLVGGSVIAALAGLALLKATNEPSLSNKWTFYTPAELDALRWADAHHRDDVIWVGPDERLTTAFAAGIGYPSHGNDLNLYNPRIETRSYLITDIIRAQSARHGRPLPAVGSGNRVYDNGTAQWYRLRPQTPYQR
jgi:hypothetical protein